MNLFEESAIILRSHARFPRGLACCEVVMAHHKLVVTSENLILRLTRNVRAYGRGCT